MNNNVSIILFGNPTNFEGLKIKSYGFINKKPIINFEKYLDFNRSYMPGGAGQETYRLIRFPYQQDQITIFSIYRLINPNDVNYNRGNYIAFGIAIKGSINEPEATSVISSIYELHGYLIRYIDMERNSLFKNLTLSDIEIKSPPSLGRIKPTELQAISNNRLRNSNKELYSVIDNLVSLPKLISDFSIGIVGFEQSDIVIFDEEKNFKGRSPIRFSDLIPQSNTREINDNLPAHKDSEKLENLNKNLIVESYRLKKELRKKEEVQEVHIESEQKHASRKEIFLMVFFCIVLFVTAFFTALQLLKSAETSSQSKNNTKTTKTSKEKAISCENKCIQENCSTNKNTNGNNPNSNTISCSNDCKITCREPTRRSPE